MPSRKPKPFTSTRNPHRETLNGAVAEYNGPITRSRVLRIHSLPFEALSEIFILALPTDQELYGRLYPYSSERRKLINPTLVFCAVCSSWRFLALSTPRLWNRINVHLPHNINEAQVQRMAADLVQWISRSHSLPLTLHISSPSLNFAYPKAPIIAVINDYAARWESLYSRDFTLSFYKGWHSLRRLCYPRSGPVSLANNPVPWALLTHLQI